MKIHEKRWARGAVSAVLTGLIAWQMAGTAHALDPESFSGEFESDPSGAVSSVVDKMTVSGTINTKGALVWGTTADVERTSYRTLSDGTATNTVLGSTTGTVAVESIATSTAQTNSGSCILNRTPSGLTIYKPQRTTRDNTRFYQQYVASPYLWKKVRLVAGSYKDQFEICVKGGSDTKPGYKMDGTGPTVLLVKDASRLLDWKWGSGTDVPTVTATLGFDLSGTSKAPVSISGGLSVTPVDRWSGAQGYHYDSRADTNYPSNTVHAWWKSGCSGWRWCGITTYSGNIVHGLWEFNAGQAVNQTFRYRTFINYHED